MWKRWIPAYLASVPFVDDQVGMVLDALERGPHAPDTIVILTSDHGFHSAASPQTKPRCDDFGGRT